MSDVVRNNAPNYVKWVVTGENTYVHNKMGEVPGLLTDPIFDDEFFGLGVTAEARLQPLDWFQVVLLTRLPIAI